MMCGQVVEPRLQQPTFVLDHPAEISLLAKPHRTRPGLVERFELFVAGAALCSAREPCNCQSWLLDIGISRECESGPK